MTDLRNRLPAALFSSFTGGWSPWEVQKSKANEVIHTFIWLQFVAIPVTLAALLERHQSIWVITGVTVVIVFVFKYICYLFFGIFESSTSHVLETSSIEPVWVAVQEIFIKDEKPKPKPKPRRLLPPLSKAGRQNSESFDNITNASWNITNETPGSSTTADGTHVTQTAGLCLIKENPEVEMVADKQFERKPNISRPGSVDYGINCEANEKRSKLKSKMESQSEPEDKDGSNIEIEALLKQQKEPIEASARVICRQRPMRKSIRRHQQPNVMTSASCTIRKETSGSDPERLSVSDAKLQAGEMLPNLSRYNGRARGRLNTLKSVLSESSVVDVTNYETDKIESPKSAEDLSEEIHSILRAKRSQDQSEGTLEPWNFSRIEESATKTESVSSNGTSKRSNSPLQQVTTTSSRGQMVGSEMTLNMEGLGSNRSSSTRSRRTFTSRTDTPTPFQVGLFNFGLRSSNRGLGLGPPNLDLPEGYQESPSNPGIQMFNRNQLVERMSVTGTTLQRMERIRRNQRKQKYDVEQIFVKKFPRRKWPFYSLNLFGSFPVKLFYTKQDLSDLVDVSSNIGNVFLTTVTCGVISIVTSKLLLLERPISLLGYAKGSAVFSDSLLFLVAASCQYSTIKSPVPDVASPGHGYALSMAFARPVYFFLHAFIMLFLFYVVDVIGEEGHLRFYGIPLVNIKVLSVMIELFRILIYLMPVLFMLGLFARLITFLNWILEVLEIVLFGGTGSSGLKEAAISLGRSVVFTIPIIGLTYLSLSSSYQEQNFDSRILSIAASACISLSYLLSRASNGSPHHDVVAVKSIFGIKSPSDQTVCVQHRLENSIVNGLIMFLVYCLIGIGNVFNNNQINLGPMRMSIFTLVVLSLLCFIGFIRDYLLPRLRSQNPWIILKRPLLRTPEYKKFEVSEAAKVMWFDRIQFFFTILSKNLLLPLVFLNELWDAAGSEYFRSWPPFARSIAICVISFSIIRRCFRDCEFQWLIVLSAYLLVFDLQQYDFNEPVLVSWFIGNIVAGKVVGLYKRLCFMYVHIMPCASTWGSAFHAISQPISMPHSGWMYFQALVSTITSAPIKPLGGASVFLASYVRPLRFWEKTYRTKTGEDVRLQSQLETHRKKNETTQRNAIFYENLALSLRNQLAGDIALGRFGNVKEGDIFILASKSTATSLNGLIQIVEIGNGVVSFQFRGLEFKGTYCQQREVEAITEDQPSETHSTLCFLDHACCRGSQRWMFGIGAYLKNLLMTWSVIQRNYVMPGYSICDSSTDLFTMYDYRKQVKTYFVRCIIYFAAKYQKLGELVAKKINFLNEEEYNSDFYVCRSLSFSHLTDIDYETGSGGVSKVRFSLYFSEWANHCYVRCHPEETEASADFLTFVFALSIIGRKSISNASQGANSADPAIFLNGLHSMFQGNIMPDFCDEWVFTDDMAILNEIIAPALRLSIKLQSDEMKKGLTLGEAEADHSEMWKEIEIARKTVICHENDPKWREAVLNNEPELFSFRHIITEDESSEYRILMLIRRHLSFKVIKINSESVRGNWAAQQEELVFVRNQNPERGSIQNARAILRNIINSSCDQPIGYPSYVSPILTSYATTHRAMKELTGEELSFTGIYHGTLRFINECLLSCVSCNSGIGLPENIPLSTMMRSNQEEPAPLPPTTHNETVFVQVDNGGSVSSLETLSSLSDHDLHRAAEIIDSNQVLSNLDGFRRGGPQFVHWENPEWRNNGGARSWGSWRPSNETKGVVVWGWYPCHRLQSKRSHIHTAILLLEVEDGSVMRYVPIQKPGVILYSLESSATSTRSSDSPSDHSETADH